MPYFHIRQEISGKCNFGACWSCVTPALHVPQIKHKFFVNEITLVEEIDTLCEVNKHIHACVCSHTYTHKDRPFSI